MSTPRRLTRRGFVATSAASTATAGAAAIGVHNRAVFAQESTPAAEALPAGPTAESSLENGDWPSLSGDPKGHRVAPVTTIAAANVTELGPSWRVDSTNEAGEPAAITAPPIVVGNFVYVQDMASNVTAYDRATGEVKWRKTYNIGCNGPNGVCYGYGNIYFGLGESANVAAVNAETGEDVWRVQLSNFPQEGIRMAPVAYGGSIYISIVPLSTNGNLGARGVLHALDALTGETQWYFDLSEENLWGNARHNSGAGLWYPPNFDDDGNIYFGNGNAAPWPGDPEFPTASSRPGPNLYASTAMSLDPDTGSVRWYFQPKPHDLFDLDYQIAPTIVNDVDINGQPTKVAITSGKVGEVAGINADTGVILWRTLVGIHENDQLQQLPDDRFVRVYPGGNGGVLTPPAYKDGVFYYVITNRPTWHKSTEFDRTAQDPFEGEVGAIDITTGNILWKTDLPTFPTGSIIVANDLVITAGLDGLVRAFTREDGKAVWYYQLGAGVNAPVVIAGDELYVAAGTQYVASPDQRDPAAEATYELVRFTLGSGGGFMPEAQPTRLQSPEEAGTPVASPAAGNAASGAATPVAAGDGSYTLAVEMGDLYFDPNAIAIPANNDVKVTLTNVGALQHDFVIDGQVDSGMVVGGGSTEFTLNLAPGTYSFYCSVEGHADAGMIGTLVAE